MIVSAYAKVNWALNVTGRRPNGYHELDMLMQTVSLCDTLALEEDEALSLTCDQADVPCDGRNMVLRAGRALQQATGCTRGARIHLEKRIPSQAGLGGGSSDCAAALHALNALWGLNLPLDALMEIGLTLGADVPFCLTGGLCRARGLGEQLTRLPAPRRTVLLVKPPEGLSTPEVFAAFDRLPAPEAADVEGAARALEDTDDPLLARTARNMLTDAAVSLCPEVGETLKRLRSLGAQFCAMSGAGSACLALFSEEPSLPEERLHALFPGAFCQWCTTR